MAMGQQKDRQGDLMVIWSEMPRSPGHVFYDRLQLVLIEGGFDGFAEAVCQPYYAARMGAPSVPPGRYFRMHLVGYFEGIDSERGLEWRCSDSLSLREFLLLEMRERVPDHSWLSRTRARLPHEVHTAVFDWVLALIAEAGLVKGERIGVDVAPTAEDPGECVTDKGYHSRLVLKALDDGPWKSRISEPKQKGFARWHGDDAARRAVTNNRTRLLSGVAWEAFNLRAEIVERSFAHNLDRGGMRRTWLRGRRERAQAIPASRRRPQPIVADAPTHRRRHPEGGRGGRNWRLVRACYARWSRPGRSDRPHRFGRMAKPPSPRYASPWRETRSMTPFSTGC